MSFDQDPNEEVCMSAADLQMLVDERDALKKEVETIKSALCLADSMFQYEVEPWMQQCFGEVISNDKRERNHRFLEEALELVQACGCTIQEAYTLVHYVFNRPKGEVYQEIGGVMITLAALCLAQKLNMHGCGNIELRRISEPSVMEKIRLKQASKRDIHSPLP